MQGSSAYADLETALPGGGDGRITIAVLDGPVDLAHPCFAGARLTELHTLAAGSGGGRVLAHGTHVASVIFGQPGSAVRGIAPACRGLIAPIFSDGGSGLTSSQLDLARAILLAVEHGAHIINISGGQLSEAGDVDSLLGDALAKCEAAGVLVVAAAGNDGCDCSHIPACVETVLAVGAADKNGAPLPFSNWGVAYQANGILAPGEAIEGAAPGGGTVRRTGSSFAAAIVSGLSGRMLAEQLAHGERPNPLRLRRMLIGTATPGDPGVDQRERFLAGRLNVAGANRELSGGRPNMSMSGIVQEDESPTASPLGPSSLAADANIGITAGDPGAIRQSGAVAASDCGCGCGGEKKECGCGGANKAAGQDAPQLVYVLGQIGYDFGTEARRDSIRQFMAPGSEMRTAELIAHLSAPENIEDVERIIWTINLDSTPIYALKPAGAFAAEAYARIFTAFTHQVVGREVERKKKKEMVAVNLFAVPGRITGSIRLMSGETVPVLVPAARGIVEWDVDLALQKFLKQYVETKEEGISEERRRENAASMEANLPDFLNDFRNLITRKYRNLGILGRERALNFASTAAFRAFEILKKIGGLELIIDDIVVAKSAACRTGSECYDVQIRVFKPSDTKDALKVFQFTLDVSDTVPVSVGELSDWRERPKD